MNRAVYNALQPLYAAARVELPRATAGEPAPEPSGPVFRKRSGQGWRNFRTAFEAACRAAKVDDFCIRGAEGGNPPLGGAIRAGGRNC
jgi:hypothetical protein